jgi:hypothetical protein
MAWAAAMMREFAATQPSRPTSDQKQQAKGPRDTKTIEKEVSITCSPEWQDSIGRALTSTECGSILKLRFERFVNTHDSDGKDSILETLSQAETTDGGTPQSLGDFENEDSENMGDSPAKRLDSKHSESMSDAPTGRLDVSKHSDNMSDAPTGRVDVKKDFRKAYFHKLFQAKMMVQQVPKHQTVLIFDWDDTLLCTHYLNRRHAWRLSSGDEECLRDIGNMVKQLLEKALNLGHHVCIITNAQKGWVEYSAAHYLPKLVPVLQRVRIISARSAFEKYHPRDPDMWKMHAFSGVQRQLDFPVVTNLISVGDQDWDINATKKIGQEFSEALIKTIKMQQNPSPDVLLKQLKLINEKFERLVLRGTSCEISLEPKSSFSVPAKA